MTAPLGAGQPRFFYALWPDAETVEQLRRVQESLPGKKTHPDDFHLTLAFLGEQPKYVLPVLHKLLHGLGSYDMTCLLNRYGRFRNLDLVWAGMSAPPPALFELHHELRQALLDNGVPFRSESTFRPHITLTRKVKAVPSSVFIPFDWRPDSLALARSGGGPGAGRYRIVASRPLFTERNSNL